MQRGWTEGVCKQLDTLKNAITFNLKNSYHAVKTQKIHTDGQTGKCDQTAPIKLLQERSDLCLLFPDLYVRILGIVHLYFFV